MLLRNGDRGPFPVICKTSVKKCALACVGVGVGVTQVMAGGPDAMAGLQNDPETMELLKKLNEAMASVKQ